MKYFKFNTFQEAFIGLVTSIINNPEFKTDSRIGDVNEVSSLTYDVEDLQSFQFENTDIGRIQYGYAEDFYKFMISGGTDAQEAFKSYPNVAKFLAKPKSPDLPDNFNTFYGPRIASQIEKIKKELINNPNSRRAVISILDARDLDLLDKDESLEFPCCANVTLSIRNNKLNIHVHMRSQNIGQVLKLDMYLWGRFACELAEELELETGKFSSSVVSAHVFNRDEEYLNTFLK